MGANLATMDIANRSPPINGQNIDLNETVPCEILAEILRFVGSPDDLTQYRDVCALWRNIIDEVIGVDLHVGHRDRTIWADYTGTAFQSPEAMSLVGVKKCYISNIDEFNPDGSRPCPTWKTPQLVQYLWIDGYIRAATFNSITAHLSHLETLELHFTTLASAGSLEDFSFNEGLASIQKLTIRMAGVEEATKLDSIGTGIGNAIVLLTVANIRRLAELSLSFPLVERMNSALTTVITHCLQRHSASLRNFSLYFTRYAETSKHLNELALPRSLPLEPADLGSTNFGLTSVKLSCIQLDHQLMKPFEDLIVDQRHLAELRCFTKYLPPDLAFQPIRNCCNTLKSIQLALKAGIDFHSGDTPYRPINLSPFERCVNLEFLEFIGREPETFPDDAEVPDLVNTAALPASLRVLTLSNFYLTSTDCSELLSKPNLKILRLYYAGTMGDLGLPFSSFVDILSQKKLDKIYLKSSINMPSIKVAAMSDNPTHSVPATLASRQFHVPYGFGAELKDGFYEVGYSGDFTTQPPMTVVRDVFLTDEDVSPYVSDEEEEEDGDEDYDEGVDGVSDESDGSVYEPDSEDEEEDDDDDVENDDGQNDSDDEGEDAAGQSNSEDDGEGFEDDDSGADDSGLDNLEDDEEAI